MAFWADDQTNFALQPDDGMNAQWGFGTLDNDDQDWNNWFAGLDAAAANLPPQQLDAFTEAHFTLGNNRLPSPVHGGYASWVTGNNTNSTRDANFERPNDTIATSSSSTNPANPPTSAPSHRNAQPAPPTSNSRQHPAPAANHSIDWLDPAEAHRPARELEPYLQRESSPSSDSSVSTSDTGYGIDIDDILTEDEAAGMPPATRRNQPRSRNSVVDLTNDPSSPPRPAAASSRKRSRDDSTQGHHSNKRSRRASNNTTPKPNTAVEELDLTNEAPSAEEELLRTQQAATIAAQQAAAESDRPLRVGQRTCIICMEPYTNATITACGHIYCHECLTQALIAGEKNSERGVGNCPVCRKPVNRKKEKQMIPVAFMKREVWRGKGWRAVV